MSYSFLKRERKKERNKQTKTEMISVVKMRAFPEILPTLKFGPNVLYLFDYHAPL